MQDIDVLVRLSVAFFIAPLFGVLITIVLLSLITALTGGI